MEHAGLKKEPSHVVSKEISNRMDMGLAEQISMTQYHNKYQHPGCRIE
jgi:hypothetical protein